MNAPTDWPDLWALVLAHSLWVGSLAAMVVALLLRRIPTDRPDLRSGIAYAGMVLTLGGALAAALSPAAMVSNSAPGSAGGSGPTVQRGLRFDPPAKPGAESNTSSATNDALLERATSRPAAEQPVQETVSWKRLVVGVWLLGVAAMLTGVGRSHLAARGLVRRASGEPAIELVHLLDLVAEKLGVTRRVVIRLSDEVASPLVYGIAAPAVLIPTSLATGAPTETLCAILAHELWHLRRGDLAWGLGQRLIESLLFFHPAVWWMSRQVDREREAACDAAAARLFGRGKPVAEALLDVADWSLGRPVAGFAMGRGFLPERVQRLLGPGGRTTPRVPWGGLLTLAAIGGVALVGLTTGARMVANEVAVALTPAERMAAIEQAIAANEPADAPRFDPTTGRISDSVPRYQVTGRFIAPLGEKLPKVIHSVSFAWEGNTTHKTIREDAVFDCVIPRGMPFYVTPEVDGYALTSFGPYKMTDGPLDLGELVLNRGHTSRLIVTDQQGEPLEGVRIDEAWVYRDWKRGSVTRGSGQWHKASKGLTSDSRGVIDLSGLAEGQELSLTLQKPGYERLKKKAVFPPGGVLTWKLAPSQPTTGQFVDTEGQPIAGVEVHCFHAEGDSLGRSDPREDFREWLEGRRSRRNREPLTATDAQGRFTLPSLKEDAEYFFIGLHRNYAPTRIDNVPGGQTLEPTVMNPPLEVRGRVIGDLSGFRRNGLYCNNSLWTPHHSHSTGFYTAIDDKGRFTLRQLLPGSLTLYVGPHQITKQLTESIDDLVIDLEELAKSAEEDFRTVRLLLSVEGLPARGTVQASWTLEDETGKRTRSSNKILTIDEEDGSVEFRALIGARLWLSDYKLTNATTEQLRLGVVPEGEGVYERSVALKPAGLVVGRVVDARGKPLTGCVVEANPLSGHAGKDDDHLTDEGRFSVGPLPLDDKKEYFCEARVTGTSRVAFSKPFKLTKAKPVHELTITVPDPVYLTGRVLDHRGKPAAGRQVRSSRSWAQRSRGTGIEPLDDEGRFRIALTPDPDVKHSFTVLGAKGSTGVTLEYQAGRWARGRDYGDIRLKPGSTVRGFVVDEAGQPLEGIKVMLNPSTGDRRWSSDGADYKRTLYAETDAEGRFEIEGVERVRQLIEVDIRDQHKIIERGPHIDTARDRLGNTWLVIQPKPEPLDLRIVLRKKSEP